MNQEAAGESALRVKLLDNGLRAELIIPAGTDVTDVTEESCTEELLKSRIEYTDDRASVVRDAVERFYANPKEEIRLVFEGCSPVNGDNAVFKWEPGCDPDFVRENLGKGEVEERIDFYNQSAFINVHEGQVLGKLLPPTDGVSGITVSGDRIEAEPGRPIAFTPDESIEVKADGTFISRCVGVLKLKSGRLSIETSLLIDEYVDFSTGNVDFIGDVEVSKGIRDKFSVHAGGTLTVHGLIESAEIKTGKHFISDAGMAAKEASQIDIGGNASARYFDHARGRIKGDLEIKREIINSDLETGGNLDVKAGAIIGGRCCVMGSAVVSQIGSAGGDRTVIMLGIMPAMQAGIAQSDELIEKLNEQYEEMTKQLDIMQKVGGKRVASNREMLTEMMFEQSMVKDKIKNLAEKRDKLAEFLKEKATVDLLVQKIIYTKTIIVAGNEAVRFYDDAKGPIHITSDEKNRLIFTGASGSAKPINEIARTHEIKRGSDEDPLRDFLNRKGELVIPIEQSDEKEVPNA